MKKVLQTKFCGRKNPLFFRERMLGGKHIILVTTFTNVTTVTTVTTSTTVINVKTVTTATTVTTIIVKYQMLFMYSSKGNFFLSLLQQNDQPTEN